MIRPKVISLFSGVGGLDQGFVNTRFNVVLASDYWDASSKSFVENHPDATYLEKDIREISSNELKHCLSKKLASFKDIDVIIGGPPCQGFSRMNNNKLDPNDPRNQLFKEFVRICNIVKPKVILMENVADLLSRKNAEGKPVKDSIVKEFSRIGYSNISSKILNAADYGTPQRRKRIFFIALKDENREITFPTPTHARNPTSTLLENDLKRWISSEEALLNIPEDAPNQDLKEADEHTKERLINIPEGGYYEHLPDELKIRKVRNGEEVIVKRYGSYLRRLHSKEPALTITNNPYYHYSEPRPLTVREKARLCGFDDDYKILGNLSQQNQQLGNCVPVQLAEALARHIKEFI